MKLLEATPTITTADRMFSRPLWHPMVPQVLSSPNVCASNATKMQMKEQTHDVPSRHVIQGMFCGTISINRTYSGAAEQEGPNVILYSKTTADEEWGSGRHRY